MSGSEPPLPIEPELDEADEPLRPDAVPAWEPAPPPTFAHPPWTVGLVLVIAVVMLILGLLAHPLWLLIGSPFIATLGVWIWVRTVVWRRRRRGLDQYGKAPATGEDEPGTDGDRGD